MSTKVYISLNPIQEILKGKSLEEKGAAQLHLATQVAKLSDPYVPFDKGNLKNSRRIEPGQVTYPMPYARRQYYENNGNGLRGSHWAERMWNDRGDEIIRSLQAFIEKG